MRFLATITLCGLLTAACRADVESGPKAGEKVGELKVAVVVGEKEGKDLDLAADRKDAPTVYLFVNAEKFSRPMARFMKKVDETVGDAHEKAEAAAIVVGGDVANWKDRLPKIQMSLKFAKTSMSVFDGSDPKGWGINADAHLTVVLVKDGKVVKSYGFDSVNETDEKTVMEEFKKAVKK
ncbi:MAG: hypothetical protein KF873_09030 [Gemmataceae bacterium]|nr:hypothetical protein [Gemmataceae bacterium]